MKLRRKHLFFWSLLPISFLFIVPLAACGNLQSIESENKPNTPPSDIDKPTVPPVVVPPTPPTSSNIPLGTTAVGLEFTPLGHSIPNPHYEKDKQNSFILANSPAKKVDNENNEPLTDAKTNTITNNYYSNIAKRSYSFNINNGGSSAYGTCWILDYQLTTDGSYPKKWYFGTNAHVLDDLKVKKDYNGYEKFNDINLDKNTYYIELAQLKDSSIGIYGDSRLTPHWKSTRVNIKNGGDNINPTFVENSKAKTVFMGTDYLDSKPSDFNQDKSWQGMEEFADFGVLEIEFETEQQAKEITNDYVNWNSNEKFHLPKTSLLNSPDKGKLQNQYVLGFPVVPAQVITDYQVMINQPKTASDTAENGQRLANSPWYQTVDDTRKGMFDGAITIPWFNATLNSGINGAEQKFKQWGLFYAKRHSNLLGGASGSLVIDNEFASIGIQWGYDMSADFGFSQALASEGYNYNGKYGSYNLPAYDLINGNVPGQKNSYKQSLKNIYGANHKTNLYPSGL